MPIYTQSSVGTIVNAKEFPISSDNQQTYNTSFANVHYGAQVGEHRIIPVTELVTFDFTYLDLDKKIDESPNYDEMVTPLNNVQPNLSAEGLNIFFSTLNDSALNINDPNLLVLPTNTNINPNGNVTIFTFGAPLSSGSGQAQGVISAEETPESEELTEEPALQANLNIENTEPENETQFANASNKIPIANADFLTITENGLVAIDVIANDVTFNLNDDLTILSANIVNDNNNGSVTIDDNKILFDPQTNFDDLATGDESSVTINYTIADSQGSTAMNMVTLTIIGTNDAPIITGDITANIAEDTPPSVDN